MKNEFITVKNTLFELLLKAEESANEKINSLDPEKGGTEEFIRNRYEKIRDAIGALVSDAEDVLELEERNLKNL